MPINNQATNVVVATLNVLYIMHFVASWLRTRTVGMKSARVDTVTRVLMVQIQRFYDFLKA